jgi:cytochrome P450
MSITARIRQWLETVGFLWRGRRNYVHVWGRSSYRREFWKERLLFRSVFIANSPETVNHVLVTHAENYPKSRSTERTLEPLVGNGLFISKGALWQRQRRLAAPAFRPSRLEEYSAHMTDASRDMIARWARVD